MLKNLLDEFADCFSNQPGLCTVIQHEINTTSDFVPRRTRAYRVPEVLKTEIEKQIDELLRLEWTVWITGRRGEIQDGVKVLVYSRPDYSRCRPLA